MSEELYKKHRPTDFDEMVGQEDAIKSLIAMKKSGDIPHALLLTGETGTGKTSLARILRKKLKCSDIDFKEVNSAEFRGIDLIREIQSRKGMAPLKSGGNRVILIDEAHQLTTAAQDAFLKLLEDTPSRLYFMLATTDPEKLKKALLNRCTPIKLRLLTKTELCKLMSDILTKEKSELDRDVIKKIAEVSEGSPRQALVILNKVIGLEKKEDQLKAIESANVKEQGKTVAQALFKKETTWKEMAAILKEVDGDPEKVRYSVLGYMRAILLKSGNPRAAMIIEEFCDNFYDSKAAGLAVACYTIIHSE